MILNQLINKEIKPLKLTDLVSTALSLMSVYNINHLPVCENNEFLGVIDKESLEKSLSKQLKISDFKDNLQKIFVLENQYYFDVLKLFKDLNTSLVTILNSKMQYLGVLTIMDVFDYIVNSPAVQEQGGIIVLELYHRDLSMFKIAQIIESENAQILSSSINYIPNSTNIELTLKINKLDIASIVSSFHRYDYNVLATYSFLENNSGTLERYNSLMNYLSFDK